MVGKNLSLFLLLSLTNLYGQNIISWKSSDDLLMTNLPILLDSSASDQLIGELKKEYDLLALQMGLKEIDLTIIKEGSIISRPKVGVVVSISELNRILQHHFSDSYMHIIRIILAHELAHQIQFRSIESMKDTPDNRTLLECQADIYSGYVWGYLYTYDLISSTTEQKPNLNTLYDIINTVYDLGIHEYALGKHPSSKERQIAFKLGLMAGVAERTLSELPSDVPNRDKVVKDVGQLCDYYPIKESFFDWSLRQSKKIINYSDKVCNYIILKTPYDKRAVFNKDNAEPFVYYNLTYLNTAPYEIIIEMEVSVYHVRRDHPNNPIFHNKSTNHNFRYILKPGEEKTFTGKLRWDGNDSLPISPDYQPRFVYPGTEDGIISCDCDSIIHQEEYEEEEMVLHLQNITAVDFASSFQRLIRESGNSFKNIRSGIGSSYEADNEEYVYPVSLYLGDDVVSFIYQDEYDPDDRYIKIIYRGSAYPDKFKEWNTCLEQLSGFKKEVVNDNNRQIYHYLSDKLHVILYHIFNNAVYIEIM